MADTSAFAYHATTTTNARVGDLQSITNALGHATQITQYNAHGQLLSTTDANGIVSSMSYDGASRRALSLAAPPPTATTRAACCNRSASRPARGATPPEQVAQPGRAYTYTYDDAQRLTAITSASGEQMLYQLDGLGNVTREEVLNSTADSGSASLLRREFDALGRLFKEIRIVNGVDQTTQMGYDSQGNLRTLQRPLEASYGESSAPVETRVYNALNQLARIEDAQYLAAQPTILAPDARDQLASVQAANNATTSYQRDGFDQVLLETSPDRGATAYTYDAAGNLRTQLSARGVTTTHSYDALNRLTATAYTQSGQTSSEDRPRTRRSSAGRWSSWSRPAANPRNSRVRQRGVLDDRSIVVWFQRALVGVRCGASGSAIACGRVQSAHAAS